MKFDLMIQLTMVSILAGIFLIIVSALILRSTNLVIVSFFIMPAGPFFYLYNKYREGKEMEERFPDFLRDVSQNIRTGMTIPQAILATKENNYGALTPYVKKMIVQLDWGVPLDKILLDFAHTTTKSLHRVVSTIIDTHRGGGNIAEIFESVGKSTEEVNKINKERSNTIYNQMLTGYVIFFVFIGVLIVMQDLIPSLDIFSSPELGVSVDATTGGSFFAETFRTLIIIQGFFSGLVIGKMSEGSIISGLKHSLILVLVGVVALTVFA
jgi:archaeal flagellar protein FlaJ